MSEGYKQAVGNVEKMYKNYGWLLSEADRATFQYNIFMLNMQPQYTGITIKEKE